MSTDETQDFLDAQSRNRGYTLEMHRIMAEVDLEWARKYGDFIEATYTGQRTLDRKTKELLQIVVEAALKADVEQIQATSGWPCRRVQPLRKSWRRCNR